MSFEDRYHLAAGPYCFEHPGLPAHKNVQVEKKKQILQLVLSAAFQASSYLYSSFHQKCSTVNLLWLSWTSAQTSASPELIVFPLTFAAIPSAGFSFSQEELLLFQLGWEKTSLACPADATRHHVPLAPVGCRLSVKPESWQGQGGGEEEFYLLRTISGALKTSPWCSY